MVVDLDDFGANHVISDMCQSHDCRDQLDKLHYANPEFKVTLFAIPGEMTAEIAEWCKANESWIQLAVHGFYHRNNYECEKMTYEEFDKQIRFFQPMLNRYFVKGFKAPGWQISDDIYRWLADNGWWVADQYYNNDRRPSLPAYINANESFYSYKPSDDMGITIPIETDAWHGHTWDCCGNGIYETYEHVEGTVKAASDFQFVSEVLK